MFLLDKAWSWRENLGAFKDTEALRVLHGPSEGTGVLSQFSVDRLGDHFWITFWERGHAGSDHLAVLAQILEFLKTKGAVSVVKIKRSERGVSEDVQTVWGCAAPRVCVREGESRFWIQLEKTKHPGLFLDHAPLRGWLKEKCKNLKVLNTFAYTGSLSIAAAQGGAASVCTLDLSKPVIQWAQDNWKLNELPEDRGRFIAGDVFEWLPRLKRQKERFDCIILDPPSFSHGKVGRFSTAKDLEKLHALALDLLDHNGFLVTSINSASITKKKYAADILAAARSKGIRLLQVKTIELPETFPVRLGHEEDEYLKGWVLQRVG